MARGRTGKITKLARSVRRLYRRVATSGQTLNTSSIWQQTLTSDYNAYNLTSYSNQALIFGTAADDTNDNSIRHVSFGMDVLIDANTEDDNIRYSVFLVSLKDEAAQAVNFSTGAITLSSNIHYQFVNGQTLLNKKYFKIHKYKRLITGNYGTALGLPSSSSGPSRNEHRFYWKLKLGTKPKNPVGNWNAMPCPRDPSQNYFLIVFNDNSPLDLENPLISMNCIHTFRTV